MPMSRPSFADEMIVSVDVLTTSRYVVAPVALSACASSRAASGAMPTSLNPTCVSPSGRISSSTSRQFVTVRSARVSMNTKSMLPG